MQSHETICHKIDRLRSDFTEQVVQLRFELGGKIETLQVGGSGWVAGWVAGWAGG